VLSSTEEICPDLTGTKMKCQIGRAHQKGCVVGRMVVWILLCVVGVLLGNPSHAITGDAKNLNRRAVVCGGNINGPLNGSPNVLNRIVKDQRIDVGKGSVIDKVAKDVMIRGINRRPERKSNCFELNLIGHIRVGVETQNQNPLRNKSVHDDERRIFVEPECYENDGKVGKITRSTSFKKIFPCGLKGFSKIRPEFADFLEDVLISATGGVGDLKHVITDCITNVKPTNSECHVSSDSNLICAWQPWRERADGLSRVESLPAIGTHNDTISCSDNDDSGTVRKALRQTKSPEQKKNEGDGLNPRYHTIFSPVGSAKMLSPNLKGNWMYRVNFIDIDVSEGGQTWFHLIGEGGCMNGFPRLIVKKPTSE
jgi:hypothetical protein